MSHIGYSDVLYTSKTYCIAPRNTAHSSHVVALLEASKLVVPHCHVTRRPAGRLGGAVKLAVRAACWTPTFRGHLAAGPARRHRSITANSTTSSFLQSLSLSLSHRSAGFHTHSRPMPSLSALLAANRHQQSPPKPRRIC